MGERKHIVVDIPHLGLRVATEPLDDEEDAMDAYGAAVLLADLFDVEYEQVHGVPEDRDPFDHDEEGS